MRSVKSAFTRKSKASYTPLPTGEEIDLGNLKIDADPEVQRERNTNAKYRKRHIVALIVLFMVVVFAIVGFVTVISKSKFRWQIAEDGTMEESDGKMEKSERLRRLNVGVDGTSVYRR